MINLILGLLLFQRLNTPTNYESLFSGDSVTSQEVLNTDSYCSLKVITCEDEWQKGEFTAYSSGDGYTPGEIMANGEKVHNKAIACPNKYEFGDKIEIEGLGTYVCKDRMAKRFRNGNYFDLYFLDISQAKKFGRQQLNFKTKE